MSRTFLLYMVGRTHGMVQKEWELCKKFVAMLELSKSCLLFDLNLTLIRLEYHVTRAYQNQERFWVSG
jgi:hypothetical protein